jgi:hypothetical protein
LALAAILALFALPAQAWETVVRDTHGLRIVELRGFTEGSESSGIALACYPDSGDSAVIFAASATRDYSLRPGGQVTIAIGDLKLPADLLANDSSETSAVSQDVEVHEILAHLSGSSGETTVNLVEMRNAELTIAPAGWEEASAEFTTACGL